MCDHSGQFDSGYGFSDRDQHPVVLSLFLAFSYIACLCMQSYTPSAKLDACVCFVLSAASPRALVAVREFMCAGLLQTPFVSPPPHAQLDCMHLSTHHAWGSPLTEVLPSADAPSTHSTSYLYLHESHCDRSYHPSCIVAPCMWRPLLSSGVCGGSVFVRPWDVWMEWPRTQCPFRAFQRSNQAG